MRFLSPLLQVLKSLPQSHDEAGLEALPLSMRIVCNQFKNEWQTDYQIVEITEEVIISAMTLAEARGLRGYDAVQLAVGCAINELCVASGLPPVVFVSADNELNLAATYEGLPVENPNHHP